jgi:hypothetical protein
VTLLIHLLAIQFIIKNVQKYQIICVIKGEQLLSEKLLDYSQISVLEISQKRAGE